MTRAIFYTSFLLIFLISNMLSAQCTGSGDIVSTGSGALGNPPELDPDSDGDIVAGGTEFTGCTGELIEFEALTNRSGCSTCQVPWTAISNNDRSNSSTRSSKQRSGPQRGASSCCK